MSANKCPSSVTPHAIRRGAITHHFAQDTPTKLVSDGMNVGTDVLEDCYNACSEHEKMEQRRHHISDI